METLLDLLTQQFFYKKLRHSEGSAKSQEGKTLAIKYFLYLIRYEVRLFKIFNRVASPHANVDAARKTQPKRHKILSGFVLGRLLFFAQQQILSFSIPLLFHPLPLPEQPPETSCRTDEN